MHETVFSPSVLEPAHDELRLARTELQEAIKTSGYPSGGEPLADDIQDILARGHQVARERTAFEQDDTKIIPERMLKPDVPLHFNDLLGMLHVYFWWNERHETPADYLEDLLNNLNDKRFKEATSILHHALPNLCTTNRSTNSNNPFAHNPDGPTCFRNWLRQRYPEEQTARILQMPMVRSYQAVCWLAGSEEVDIEDDEPAYLDYGELNAVLGEYAVGALLAAGLEPIEAQDAENTLEKELLRRLYFPQDCNVELFKDYNAFRLAGQTFEAALRDLLPHILVRTTEDFEDVLNAYQDIPQDAINWPADKKLALARRYVDENRDLFEALEHGFQLSQYGSRPFYQRRFAEDMWPPSERI